MTNFDRFVEEIEKIKAASFLEELVTIQYDYSNRALTVFFMYYPRGVLIDFYEELSMKENIKNFLKVIKKFLIRVLRNKIKNIEAGI